MVGPAVDDLRGRVERAAAEGLEELVLVVQVGQPEVCDLRGGENDLKVEGCNGGTIAVDFPWIACRRR